MASHFQLSISKCSPKCSSIFIFFNGGTMSSLHVRIVCKWWDIYSCQTATNIFKYSEVRPVMGLGELSASELCLQNRRLVSKVLKLLLGTFVDAKWFSYFVLATKSLRFLGAWKLPFFKSAILSYIDAKDWQALI